MIQEEDLNITTQLTPVLFQVSKDSLNKPHDPYSAQAIKDSVNDIRQFYTFSYQTSQDSLNSSSQLIPFQAQANNKTFTRFFVEKGTTHLNEIKRSNDSLVPLWVHLSFIFWVVVVLFTRQSYTYRLGQILSSTFSQQQVKQLRREGNFLKQGFPVLLIFLYAFTLSLLAFNVINLAYPNSFYFSLGEGFLILFGVVILFHFAKFISIWLIGFMFETRQISYYYLLEQYIFQISEGIIIFPLLILYVYSGMLLFLYGAAAVLLALWAYRLLRAVIVGLECTNFSRYYLLLYLCTLEVLPIFMLYKLGLQFV